MEEIDLEIDKRKQFMSEALKTLLVGSLAKIKIDVNDPEQFSELLKRFFQQDSYFAEKVVL